MPKVIVYSYFFISLLIFFIWTLKPLNDYTKSDPKAPTDFIMYITGASIVRDGKVKELYDRNLQISYQNMLMAPNKMNGLLAFRALPVTAYLYIPLLYLNPVTAFYVQLAINMILLLLSIRVIRKAFQLNSDGFWLCTATILAFIPFRAVVLGGQISVLMLLVLCLAIYFAKRSKYLLAGALLGLLLLKINLLVAVPFFFFVEYLQNKQSLKKLALGFFLTALVIVGVNILIYGPNLLTVYPKFLLASESLGYGTALFRNYNPLSVMSLLTENRTLLFGGTIAICLVNAYLFTALFRKTKNTDLLYATVPALGLFLNFHTMSCDLILLTLSIFLLGNYYIAKAKKPLIGLLKCFGVILFFDICTWIAIYDWQIPGLVMMLAFFYLTLRSSVIKTL